MKRLAEPKVMKIVLRYADNDRNTVIRAYLCKGTGCVAGRLNYQNPLVIRIHPGKDAVGLSLLERTGTHLRADPRIPP